jgi:hypothetical protein
MQNAFTTAKGSGPFQLGPLRAVIDDVIAHIELSAEEFMNDPGQNLGHLEEGLLRPLYEAARAALEQAAQRKADQAGILCPLGHKLTKRVRVKTTVDTRYGPITVTRTRGWCKRCGAWFCPADLLLGIEGGKSPSVQEAAALLNAKMPAPDAAAVLQRLTGLTLPATTLARVARKAGEKGRERRQKEDEQTRQPGSTPEWAPAEPFTLVVQIDAWNIRERDDWGRSAEMRAQGLKPERWHWVYTGTVFQLGDRVEKEGGRRIILRRGYAATRQGVGALSEQLYAESLRRGLGRAERVLVVADGAVWIWNLAGDRFKEATQLLDLYHAKEHLWTVANALHGAGTPEARAWIKPLEEQMEASQTAQVIASLEEALAGLEGASHETVEKEAAYFRGQEKRMDYAGAKARGEPCGSGPVESTCRQYQCRFKRTGQFWTKEGDEALMCLETFWRNGRWEHLFPHAAGFDPRKN